MVLNAHVNGTMVAGSGANSMSQSNGTTNVPTACHSRHPAIAADAFRSVSENRMR